MARRGNTLTIDFAHVASIAQSEAATRSEMILAVSPRRRNGRTTVILTLVPEARVRHFRHTLDVVDILPPLPDSAPTPASRTLAAADDPFAAISR